VNTVSTPNSARNTDHTKLLYLTHNTHIYFNMISGNSVTSQITCSKGKKVKGRVGPGKGHEGPKVEKWYNYTLSLTSELDVGGWSTPRPGRFTLGKDPEHIVQETGWDPGPAWTGVENLAPHRDSIPGPHSP
jgi:hypothetical protein